MWSRSRGRGGLNDDLVLDKVPELGHVHGTSRDLRAQVRELGLGRRHGDALRAFARQRIERDVGRLPDIDQDLRGGVPGHLLDLPDVDAERGHPRLNAS